MYQVSVFNVPRSRFEDPYSKIANSAFKLGSPIQLGKLLSSRERYDRVQFRGFERRIEPGDYSDEA